MTELAQKHLQSRKRAEARFRRYGQCAIGLALLALAFLLIILGGNGIPSFFRAEIRLDIGQSASYATGDARKTLREALRHEFPELTERGDLRKLYRLVSGAAYDTVKHAIPAGETTVWVPASDAVDLYHKGKVDMSTPEDIRIIDDTSIGWVEHLRAQGKIRIGFNTLFFTQADSREPGRAGFLGAIAGSFFTMLVCLLVAFPLGVLTAVYLEEFAPKNFFTDIIEVNINNLAAVPSIVFGLLGLSVFLIFFELPRSAPLVGGLTLALMTLPTIIITTRVALKAIPPSVRQAAVALGASKLQAVAHHVVPLALPGIMTGTILGAARAIGETAPLLMIGMVAFIADVPTGFADPATVMPVQIYIWASSPELGFVEKTSTGILVLLVLLLAMNALAIYIRKRFEVRW